MPLKSAPVALLAAAVLAFAFDARAEPPLPQGAPPGYHVETSANVPLIVGGAVLGALSIPAFIAASSANDYTARTDTNELVGPYLTMGGLLCAAGGLALISVGIAFPRETLVRDTPSTAHLFLAPVLGPTSRGFTTGVVF